MSALKPSEENRYLIHEACRDGRYQTVEELLSANPSLTKRKDPDGRLPLHLAISHNRPQTVTLLSSQKDFDPDIREESTGWTPLMMACSIPDGDEVAEVLLKKGADVNAKNNNNQTALHFLASKQRLPLCRRFLQNYRASARTLDKRRQLPLHRAAAVGSSPLILLLLEHNSPINTRDLDGQTPLHHAVAEGHGDAAMTLLKKGAESDVEDSEGRLPIECAPDKKVGMFVLTKAKEEGIHVALPKGLRGP